MCVDLKKKVKLYTNNRARTYTNGFFIGNSVLFYLANLSRPSCPSLCIQFSYIYIYIRVYKYTHRCVCVCVYMLMCQSRGQHTNMQNTCPWMAGYAYSYIYRYDCMQRTLHGTYLVGLFAHSFLSSFHSFYHLSLTLRRLPSSLSFLQPFSLFIWLFQMNHDE